MAFFDNKHWILKRINTNFSTHDDTGLCDLVLAGEDYTKLLSKTLVQYPELSQEYLNTSPTSEQAHDFETYSDDSGDIQIKRKHLRPRIRSNTLQWLEIMNKAENKTTKTKNVLWSSSKLDEQVIDKYFSRKTPKNHYESCTKSLLTKEIETSTRSSVTSFLKYAKFDGKSQDMSLVQVFRVAASILPEPFRNYPLYISVLNNAKVHQVIGFICLKLSMLYDNLQLKSVKHYSLYIEEQFGCVDTDFPCLNRKEQIKKFQFQAIVLDKRNDISTEFCSDSDSDSENNTAEKFIETQNKLIDDKPIKKSESLGAKEVTDDISLIEKDLISLNTQLHQSYNILLINRLKSRSEVILDINCDTLTVQILNTPKTFFGSNTISKKAYSHCIDNIAWVKILTSQDEKATFRIYYVPSSYSKNWNQSSHEKFNFNSLSLKFQHYDFETSSETANEIVNKINSLLEIKSSLSRKFYMNLRDQPNKKFNFYKRFFDFQ